MYSVSYKNIMETGSEGFANQITSYATDRLIKSRGGMAFISKEQGGVKLAEDDLSNLSPERQAQLINLLGITELSAKLRRFLFEQSEQGNLIDGSKLTPESSTITNQSKFVQELLGKNPRLLNKLAEITAKARVFAKVFDQQQNESTQKIAVKIKTWEHTIDELALTFCSNEAEKLNYQQLVADYIMKLNSPSQRTVTEIGGLPKTTAVDSYAMRLNRLIQKPRALELMSSFISPKQGEALADNVVDEYLETAFTINAVRVLDRIQRPLGFIGKYEKLISCLEGREVDQIYTKIIADNNLLKVFYQLKDEIKQVHASSSSDQETTIKVKKLKDDFKEKCRFILENSFAKDTDQEEMIDLVSAKSQVADLYQQATEINKSSLEEEEKKQQLANLDQQMQSLMILIANKVNRVFPHQTSTNLSDVLESEDAICAGKVNILLAISKYLGINARANSVEEALDNEIAGHVCYECDLPSGINLVIDANFSNKSELEGKTDEELTTIIQRNNPVISNSKLKSSLKYMRLAIENARFIPANSRVLVYTTENTGKVVEDDEQLQQIRVNPNLLARINPYTGKKEVWQANIPHPHLITFPDKDGYLHINSSFTNNNTVIAPQVNREVEIYLSKRQIEMSPYDTAAYTDLAQLLPKGEGIIFLEKIKETLPDLYWEAMSVSHALLYAAQGNLDVAVQVFEETKNKNSQAYYHKVHELSELLGKEADKETGEKATKLRERAKELMESARMENPAIFYSNQFNIFEITRVHQNQIDKMIEVYEQFKNTQEESFWDADSIVPPFQWLMEYYLRQAKADSSSQSKAIEFANEIKNRDSRHYAKRVSAYASELFLLGEKEDLSQAIAMIETVKNENEPSFFAEVYNIIILEKIYERVGDIDKAIVLLEESRIASPESFWNDKSGPLYESLARLYTRSGQLAKTIKLYEDARDVSQQFWQTSHNNRGYSQLAILYAKTKRISDAIDVCTEAQLKDPSFFNPESNNRGYIQLASLYDQDGQTNEAIRVMQIGVKTDEKYWANGKINPNSFKLVNYYEKTGQFDKAIEILKMIREKNVEYLETDYYRICELYEKNGNLEESARLRAELIGIYEDLKATDLALYYHSTEKLAHLYRSDGQLQKAITVQEENTTF